MKHQVAIIKSKNLSSHSLGYSEQEMPQEVATYTRALGHPALNDAGAELSLWANETVAHLMETHKVPRSFVHIGLGKRYIDPILIKYPGATPGVRREYYRIAIRYEAEEVSRYFQINNEDQVIDVIEGVLGDGYVTAVILGRKPATTIVSLKHRRRSGVVGRLLNLIRSSYNEKKKELSW